MFRVAILLAVAIAAFVLPGTAFAWRHGGWGWGGVFIGPPILLAPAVPVYDPYYRYAPPPPAGEACYAGAWVCPLDQPGPRGAPCTCPTNQGRVGGRIG